MALAAKYPKARFQAADPSNYRAGRKTPVTLIVIHITSGRERAQPVADMWTNEKHHGSSAHCVIDQDGSIIQGIRFTDTAWHASNANAYSIGIEHCAREPGEFTRTTHKPDAGLPVSEAQYQSSAVMVAWICKGLGLQPTRDSIKGHCEVDVVTTHTGCPNSIWDWDHYMALVQAEYAKL